MPGYRARPPRLIAYGHGYAVTTVLLRPKSRGRVTLARNGGGFAPVINPHFFEAPEDLETLLLGFKESRRILEAAAFQKYEPFHYQPETGASDEDLRQYILENSATIFHPVGTCKMGHDAQAVVNDRLAVHGIAGLRVIDASVMPHITSGNTNAPTVMIAEKGAEFILQGAQ